MNQRRINNKTLPSMTRKYPSCQHLNSTVMPFQVITAPQADSRTNMNVNGHSIWLSNNPKIPTQPSSTTSPPSPGVRSDLGLHCDNATTIPGGTTASLAFYTASLASRLKQMNEDHHAAFVYTTLQDPFPLIYHGTDLPKTQKQKNRYSRTNETYIPVQVRIL